MSPQNERQGIEPNTYVQLIQLLWTEGRACTLYLNTYVWCTGATIWPCRLDQLYVFGAIPWASILQAHLYKFFIQRNYQYDLYGTIHGALFEVKTPDKPSMFHILFHVLEMGNLSLQTNFDINKSKLGCTCIRALGYFHTKIVFRSTFPRPKKQQLQSNRSKGYTTELKAAQLLYMWIQNLPFFSGALTSELSYWYSSCTK